VSPNAVGPTGGNQPHNNMQPYLALQFCVLGYSSGEVVPGNTPFTASLYSNAAASATLNQTIGNTGSGQAHENRMPSLVLSFCIEVDHNAEFPPRG
jgi:microcystin-dependent protein